MLRSIVYVSAVLLLIANGALHGLWTQRWSGLTEQQVQAAAERLACVPLKVGEWTGHRIETDSSLAEEIVGKNIAVRYVNRVSGQAVLVYLACGNTAAMELHTPVDCYPSQGYRKAGAEQRVSLLANAGLNASEFKSVNFSKGEAPAETHLRVFWSWKDAGSWRTPRNVGRAFRAAPYLFKCYAIRSLISPDEPLEGDPCTELLNDLIPELNRCLADE
jgi:hypothetical protein